MRVAEYTRGWRALNRVLRVNWGCFGARGAVSLFGPHDISLMIAGFPPLISTSAESLLVLQRQSRHFSDIKQRRT